MSILLNKPSQLTAAPAALAEIKNEIENAVLNIRNRVHPSVSAPRNQKEVILLKAATTMIGITKINSKSISRETIK